MGAVERKAALTCLPGHPPDTRAQTQGPQEQSRCPTGLSYREKWGLMQILVLAHGSPTRTVALPTQTGLRVGDLEILGKGPQAQGCLGLGHTAQGHLPRLRTEQYHASQINTCFV